MHRWIAPVANRTGPMAWAGVTSAVLAAVYVLKGRSVRQRLSLFAYVFVIHAACTVALALLGDVPDAITVLGGIAVTTQARGT